MYLVWMDRIFHPFYPWNKDIPNTQTDSNGSFTLYPILNEILDILHEKKGKQKPKQTALIRYLIRIRERKFMRTWSIHENKYPFKIRIKTNLNSATFQFGPFVNPLLKFNGPLCFVFTHSNVFQRDVVLLLSMVWSEFIH